MISLVLCENAQDLEKLKQRSTQGEKIYAMINGKTMLLLPNDQAQAATKSEVTNFVKNFRFEEDKTESTARNDKTSSETPTPGMADTTAERRSEQPESQRRGNDALRASYDVTERVKGHERRIEAIENALNRPILGNVGQGRL